MTKKLLLTVASVVAVTMLFFHDTAHSYSSTPPANNSSAPGQSSCGGASCHSSNTNSGTGNVAIGFGDGLEQYVANETYDITVTITDSDALRYGFEMVAFDESNASIGQFGDSGDQFVEVREVGGVNYANHVNVSPGNSNVFSFTWTAPDTEAGEVSFYVAANAADGSGSGGDEIYTSSLAITEFVESGIKEQEIAVRFYPNPSSSQVFVEFPATNGQQQIEVFNTLGQMQFTALMSTGETIQVSDWPKGMYLLKATDSSWSQKLMVK